MSTFPSFTEFTQSLFYRLMHKTLSSNWIQILWLQQPNEHCPAQFDFDN